MRRIPSGSSFVDAYCSRPATPDASPGVVVLHDIAGLGTDARAQVDWLADEGFLAAAPDLFDGGSVVRCLRSIMRDYTSRRGRTFNRIEATRTWLVEQPGCTGAVAILGFCLGGDFALRLAASGKYQAASINYARVPTDVGPLLGGSCPIVASYGARGRIIAFLRDHVEGVAPAAG